MLSEHSKVIFKTVLKTYALLGAVWWFNETSPLGWWSFRFRPKEERELAHLYERRKFPYPGDEEAVREFIEKGGALGTTIGPRGFIDKEGNNVHKKFQEEKFEREVQMLWQRMLKEVVEDLEAQGYKFDK